MPRERWPSGWWNPWPNECYPSNDHGGFVTPEDEKALLSFVKRSKAMRNTNLSDEQWSGMFAFLKRQSRIRLCNERAFVGNSWKRFEGICADHPRVDKGHDSDDIIVTKYCFYASAWECMGNCK
uniref:Uncharacterized protein n=1 Tax=Candidatus Kentrum sp. TC TaxID=2126339 RepID=A0A450ZTZ1_9GAMM|nr:MAG: hypothetical protein BECKTC1821F_GA0114240_10169 [Candidatus Kentron sp. TC]